MKKKTPSKTTLGNGITKFSGWISGSKLYGDRRHLRVFVLFH